MDGQKELFEEMVAQLQKFTTITIIMDEFYGM